MIAFSLRSIGCSTTDSLRPIAPKGYVLFTYDGARKALQSKVDADECNKILSKQDSVVMFQKSVIRLKDREIGSLKSEVAIRKDDMKKLKWRLFVRTFELCGALAAATYLMLK